MADKPRIYIEACPFIDLAKTEAKLPLADPKNGDEAERQKSVWFCKKLIEAARDGHIEIFTSGITVAECTQVEKGVAEPSEEIKRFYEELLTSGRAGILLVQPTQTILNKARDLK